MVSPVMRRLLSQEHRIPPTTERKKQPQQKQQQTPAGMTLVSPTTSSMAETPSTIGRITPTRRMLFDRTTPRNTLPSRPSMDSVESRQEIEDLRLSCKKKDNEIRDLHHRFQSIQVGLGSIDQERATLVEKAKTLEKEKKQLQRQLDIREKEILVLVQRCASQEEKLRGSTKIENSNRELTESLQTTQYQNNTDEQVQEDLRSLRRKLQKSELAREQLQDQLRKVQQKHDSIVNTLGTCFEKMKQLTEEKELLEEEQRQERKRSEIEMERQRLAHIQVANELKDDIDTKQLKIEQMERFLQESMYVKTNLRREKALNAEESREILSKYEQKIEELQHQLDSRSDTTNESYKETLVLLQKKIDEKDALMESLELEFSGQMDILMRQQSSLDEVEEEKKSLENKVQQFERLECDHSALREYVRVLDSNLADLTSENAHLNLDKEKLEEEAESLRLKMRELESQLCNDQEHREERNVDSHASLEAEMQELREKLDAATTEAQADATLLEEELTSSRRLVADLEKQLQVAQSTILRKEEEIHNILKEKEEVTSNLQSALVEAKKEAAHLGAQVEFYEHKQKSLAAEQTEGDNQERLVEAFTSQFGSVSIIHVDDDGAAAMSSSEEIIDAELLDLGKRTIEANLRVEKLQEQICSMEETNLSGYGSIADNKAIKAELDAELQRAKIDLRMLQEESYSLKLESSVVVIDDDEDILRTEQSGEEIARDIFQNYSLDSGLGVVRAERQNKETRIDQLHADFETARSMKEFLFESLKDANENAVNLQSELGSQCENKMENSLESAQAALSDHFSTGTVRANSQREDLNRQASSRLVVLENHIVELKEKKEELKGQLREAEKVVASKDRQLALLEREKGEWEKRSAELHVTVDEEKEMRQSLEAQVLKKNEINLLLQSELDDTVKELSTYEKRIKQMDKALLDNQRARQGLEQELSETTDKVMLLEEELSEMRSKTRSLNEQLESTLKDLEYKTTCVRDTELKLEEKTLKLSQMEKNFESTTQSHQMTTEKLLESEKRLVTLEELVTSHNETTQSLSAKFQESSQELDTLRVQNRNLESQVEDLNMQKQRADLASQKCSELEGRIKDFDQLLESKEKELAKVRNDLTLTESTLAEATAESSNLKSVVKSLEDTLSEFSQSAKSAQEGLEVHLNEERQRYDQASSKLAEVQILLSEERQKALQYQHMVSDQDEKIETLRSEMRETVATKNKKLESATSDFSERIRQLETDIALKDDEIQELRVVELKDKEEAIANLTESLENLKEQKETSEAELTGALNDVKHENEHLRSRMEEQDKNFSVTRKRYEEEITRVIEEQTEKLRDRSNVISEMARREAELEKQEEVLLASSEQLIKAERAAKEEVATLKKALDVQILRATEERNQQRREIETRARQETSEMKSKMRGIEIKLVETESILKERTILLSEMVEHNHDLESRLDKQQAQFEAMEEETTRSRYQLSETQSELLRAREDLCHRENALTAKLNEERSHRNNAERALSKFKVEFKDSSRDRKLVAQLQQDNKTLKDKIMRQEAYLQRKLQKEREDRARSTSVRSSNGSVSSARSSSVRSPGPQTPPPRTVRTSLLRAPTSASRITGATSVTNHDSSSTRSSRSISSLKTPPRSNIPKIMTTTTTTRMNPSISFEAFDSRNDDTSITGRGNASESNAAIRNESHSFAPTQRDA